MEQKEVFKFFDQIISENEIVLFMKGTEDFPQCGFSAAVVAILQKLEVQFKSVNVLENMDIREGIKQYSDWPTIPQLYIKGEFIGGCDIVKELFQTKELFDILDSKNIVYKNNTKHNART
ncbi:MAG: Grx4 family monothiol glutaredoxin [Rickettsiaceae bacterium]|nr:Grx4 family monothiol glutaredoxin [Rickettsiaceae bacterium]